MKHLPRRKDIDHLGNHGVIGTLNGFAEYWQVDMGFANYWLFGV
jgi:hypothetical protein